MTLQHDNLTAIIDSITELKRMKQLNIELLEQLAVTCRWLRISGISLPNASTFDSLLNKTITLLDEIQADTPIMLQYNVNRRKVTPYGEKDGTDEEVPAPFQGFC